MKKNKFSIDYPLRGSDILKILNNNTNIIEYKQLYNIEDLEDIFINGSCVILYRSAPNLAHWCCIFKNIYGLEFFDPYGCIIDNEINEIEEMNPNYANNYYNNGHKRLLELVLKTGYNELTYNNYKLQQMKHNINTCGRHCAVRLLFKNLNLEDYVDYLFKISKNKYLDEIVLKITNKLI
jgi:hypothetical protein